jgi:hypothetical protein
LPAAYTISGFVDANAGCECEKKLFRIKSSELGQEAEAQAEVAAILRISPNYSLQIARQTWPVKDPAVLERDLAALRKAGLK